MRTSLALTIGMSFCAAAALNCSTAEPLPPEEEDGGFIGVGTGGSGGLTQYTGGAPTGTGGTSTGTGAASTGTGGTISGSGGVSAGTGGVPSGTGGAVVSSGGTSAWDGGFSDAGSMTDASVSPDASSGGTSGSGGASGGTSGSDGSTGGTSGSGGSTGGTSGSGGTSSGGTSGSGGSTGGTSGSGGASGGSGGASGGSGGASGGSGGASTGGTSGSGGAPETGGAGGMTTDAGTDGGPPPNTLPGFMNLAPPMLQPLDPSGGTPVTPAPPTGWTWYEIEGTQCRDGSPTGIYVRFTQSDKLFIYLEGGGACTNLGFCNYNPANVNMALSGTGETVLGSALGVVAARQQPGVYEGGVLRGIFDTANTANPFRDWNAVYIPYCTGDVHFGTKANATVPGVTAPQQFVGYFNMQKFVGHIVPTFENSVNRVVLMGASAGSFGAAVNFSMIQDAFGDVLVDGIMDSGVPFSDAYMPVCMQKKWRETWGLNNALPPDCTACFNADGGGLLNLGSYLLTKHPNSRLAMVSGTQDEVMRLFFSMGLDNCSDMDTDDPVAITLLQGFPNVYYQAADYEAGLNDMISTFDSSGRLATYLIGGLIANLHQHTYRQRFFEAPSGATTIAQYTTDFLNGQVPRIGP